MVRGEEWIFVLVLVLVIVLDRGAVGGW
jgi:hypothetical protein